jgi:hypothetical protein
MMPIDPRELAADVKTDLAGLNELFAQLSGTTLARIPRAVEDVPDFLTLTAGLLGSLTLLQAALFTRIVKGQARLAFDREPPWAVDFLSGWSRLPDRQPAARRVEPRLRSLLDGLNARITYLTEEAFASLPPDPEDVPEFLALVLLLERHLTWYLEPSLLARLWPDRWHRPPSSQSGGPTG